MENVAEKIARQLPSNHVIRKILEQRSAAYGSVAGAIENVAGCIERGQLSDGAGRQAHRALVNAIHAPREEAERYANEITLLARDVVYRR